MEPTRKQIARVTGFSDRMISSHNITISFDSLIDEIETLRTELSDRRKYVDMLEAQIIKGNTPAIDRLKADISVLELEADQAKERETVLAEDLRKARAHRDRLLDERNELSDRLFRGVS